MEGYHGHPHVSQSGAYNLFSFRACGTQYQPASDLVFWQSHEKFRTGQGNTLTYIRMLRRDTGLELDEMHKVALNRDGWRDLCHRAT